MTDRITKILRKTSEKNRKQLLEVFESIKRGNTQNLDIKQLSGKKNLFRVRSRDFRILLEKTGGQFFIVDVRKRDERTYRNI